MNNPVTLKTLRSQWKKFNEELASVVAVMQEQQRESEERWVRIADLKAEASQLRESRQRARMETEALLGSSDVEWATQSEIWREEKLRLDTENERLRFELELKRQRRLLPPASQAQLPPNIPPEKHE